ncbi:MAG: trypsin-like serine protease [Pseudomonadota bacterium]
MLFLSCFFIFCDFFSNVYASDSDNLTSYPIRLTKPSYPIATEEMLTDEGARELAGSNSLFCSVGCLTVFSGKTVVANGSASYLGGLMCVTAAHCVVLEYSDMTFSVSFTLDSGRVETRDVERFDVYPDYNSHSKAYDIAVLKLKESIDGLVGLVPCFHYGKVEKPLRDLPEVMFVGYCGAYSETDYLSFSDEKRRASKSRLCCDYGNKGSPGIFTVPYRANTCEKNYIILSCFPYKLTVTVARPPMEYELGVKSGMSGGAVFEVNIDGSLSFIAVLIGDSKDKMSHYNSCLDQFIPVADSWLDCFRCCFDIPHIRRPTKIYEGKIAISLPFGAVEEWLEGWRQKFDGACV